ncbi:MAG: hypothetical protein A3E78_14490 [Alphaproteobacteria bacterium RIFCSPHIGHO2_12_FULL_63_12]|nr:MAG: hypothetical protein A3E78_14490 [Alphaproteobacteria bacterium RIFCSPHIGHO2_12_FULL_63_12]
MNGHECSFADIKVHFNVPGGATVAIVDLEGIKWDRKVEFGESRGTSGGRVMKRTRGQVSYEASATVTRAGCEQLKEAIEVAALAAGETRGNQVIISGVAFDILIQHTPFGDSRIYEAKLSGCRYSGDGSDSKQGNEPDMIELNLSPIEISTKSSTGAWIVLL